MKQRPLTFFSLLFFTPVWAQEPGTAIAKWQDGKAACISLTYDDSSINQFRIDMPLLNERRLPGTFYVVTGDIQGSKNGPIFVGRPIMDIIRESEKVPTTKDNAFERMSVLNYLQSVQHVVAIKDFRAQSLERLISRGDWVALGKVVDAALGKLRSSGISYEAKKVPSSAGDPRLPITWDLLRRYAAMGHEFASHTISHPFTPALDEANIAYELDKSTEDIREQLGARHTFSAEVPYGIDDARVRPIATSRFPITRNWVTDEFMEGIMRDDDRDPASSTREYVQWQRGALSRTSLETMKGWVDTSIGHGIWLVLVFHGVEGIGWEPLSTETTRAYYDYIADHQSRLWIATFEDATKYVRERMASKIASKRSGDTIEVTVTCSLDPAVYDLPLTARTRIPDDWRIVHFLQSGEQGWLPIHRERGSTFVSYRIKPNGAPATLEKGPN
jgi:peptidoglycan/xylan/chitin deacetylase (PgdA/CDA1 family)